VNFLPVGHTHEDVDQFFSKVATQLRAECAEGMKCMFNYIYVYIYICNTLTPKIKGKIVLQM